MKKDEDLMYLCAWSSKFKNQELGVIKKKTMVKNTIKCVGIDRKSRKIRNHSARKWTVETLIGAGYDSRNVKIHVGQKSVNLSTLTTG